MLFTSGTFTSAHEFMPILHDFLTTSAGYTANRAPLLSASYWYSNYQKTVTAFNKTNTICINVMCTTSAALPARQYSNSSNGDTDAWGLRYTLSTDFTSSALFVNQPGVLRENNGSGTNAEMTQYLRIAGTKTYIIISDGNSVFINIDRGISPSNILEDNATIYWCGVVDPTGAGNYIGGSLITGAGINNIYYSYSSSTWNSNSEKNYSNILFATTQHVASTVMTLTTSATSGNMYSTKTVQWYNGPDDIYYKRLITNVSYNNSYYNNSVLSNDSSYVLNKSYNFSPDANYSKIYFDHKTGSFDSITGRLLPSDIQLFAHRGSEKYSYLGTPPNIKLLPTPMQIKTFDKYGTFVYNGETYLIVSFYAVKI